MYFKDYKQLSTNLLVYSAPKIQLSIKLALRYQFKKVFLRLVGVNSLVKYLQYIYYLSILITPSALKQLGVRYYIKAYYPSKLIFTTLSTYYQVINIKLNIIEAINFIYSTTLASPTSYRFYLVAAYSVIDLISLAYLISPKYYLAIVSKERLTKKVYLEFLVLNII